MALAKNALDETVTPPMTLPRAAIVYLTYNGKDSYEDITRCFNSLKTLDYPRELVELICVENPSSHGESWPFIEKEWRPLSERGEFPCLTVIRNEKDGGYSGANVVGLEAAARLGCSYAFLLNQDADIDPGFLHAAVERAERDPKVGYVQSLVLLGQDRNRVNSAGNRYHFLGFGYSGGYGWTRVEAEAFFERERRRGNADLIVPTFSGAAVLVRVAMAEEIGLFDPKFYMYHEDIDATFNARIRGWKSVIEPSSVVYHYYQFSKSIKKFYWMERNRFVVNLTYYKTATLALLALPFFGVELISFFFSLRSGWWREKLKAWAFFLKPSTWVWVMQRRKKAQSARVISDREFFRWAEARILFQEGDASNSFVSRVANPLMDATWKILYAVMWW